VQLPGKGRFIKAYGTADLTTRRPMEPALAYRVASISKTFTATAILRLVDSGRIHLADTLNKYVAGVPYGERITIRDLLAMRSGVYNFVDDPDFERAYNADPLLPGWKPEDILPIITQHPREAQPPGIEGVYSDSNYVLLGLILEKVTQQPAEQWITKHVIRPLELEDTSFPTTAQMPDSSSRGYTRDQAIDPIRDVTASNPKVPWTAGGMVSTVPDLTQYVSQLAEGALLKESTQRQRLHFQALKTTSTVPVYYGLGLLRIGQWLGHDGAIFGYSGLMFRLPKEKATIVVMCNVGTTTGVTATPIWLGLASHFFPGSFTTPATP
jgi:D-alanyl-D-alanine carboxypeptidase